MLVVVDFVVAERGMEIGNVEGEVVCSRETGGKRAGNGGGN
jgi:hypothetical protein